jgi:hypothetical protein
MAYANDLTAHSRRYAARASEARNRTNEGLSQRESLGQLRSTDDRDVAGVGRNDRALRWKEGVDAWDVTGLKGALGVIRVLHERCGRRW